MSSADTARNPGVARSDRSFIAYLAALSGLSAFGIDAVLPGLSDIRSAYDLAPDANEVALVVTTYLFGLGMGQVLYGPLADRFGRRPAVHLGLGLYAAAAAGSALAPSLILMFVARFLMGVGAASPRAMSLTIARDRYDGDAMTRVVSLVMLFFQLSPAVAPLLGEGLLVLGPWQGIFGFATLLALMVMLWTRQVEETLAPEHRRPLTFARTMAASRAIVGSRWAFGHGLVLMFEFSAFYVYLSSSELVFDSVFGRADIFAVCFAVGALVQAASNYASSRVAPRIGTSRLAALVVRSYVVLGAVFVALSIAGDGRPDFWLWLVVLWALNALHALVLTTANSLAMQPLAAFAGTGSGLIGTMSMMGGAILSSIVASTIERSATPMALAYLGFGLLAGVSLWWADGGDRTPIPA